MKIQITFLMIFISLITFGQTTEVVLTGGIQDNNPDINNVLYDAIYNPNGSLKGNGTVTIKGNIIIKNDFTIPKGINLNFFKENKLIVSNGVSLNIKGNIKPIADQIFETTELDHNIKIYNQPVYPEWFGECGQKGRTNANDDIPIQKAFNSLAYGGEVFFNGYNYILSKTITVSQNAIKIKGKGTFGISEKSNTISISDSIESIGIIFHIGSSNVKISDLNFLGKNNGEKGANTVDIAISFDRLNNTEDIDAKVENCGFLNFKTCIYAEGTNLKITDNLFTANHTGIRIKESSDLNGVVSPHTRGHIISRNRFHSLGSTFTDSSLVGSTCIKILHDVGVVSEFDNNGQLSTSYGYYNQITNNYADDCKTFYTGSISRTMISNNMILFSKDTAIKAVAGSDGIISNNLIDGSINWNPNRLFQNSIDNAKGTTGHGIYVKNANHLTIHNNQISNKRLHGIFIERSFNSSIQSNTITDFNRLSFTETDNDGDNIKEDGDLIMYDGIHIDNTMDNRNIRNIVSNNTISINHTGIKARYGIYVGDGDNGNFVKNNFILPTRLLQSIKIE